MWVRGLATRGEAETRLQADVVPLIIHIENVDGTTKTEPRPRALLEPPVKLIESVAVDQVADLIVRSDVEEAGWIQCARRGSSDDCSG